MAELREIQLLLCCLRSRVVERRVVLSFAGEPLTASEVPAPQLTAGKHVGSTGVPARLCQRNIATCEIESQDHLFPIPSQSLGRVDFRLTAANPACTWRKSPA